MSVWNSNPYMLLSKCLFGIQILTCYSPNVCLEFQSFHASLQMSVGILILTCFSSNVCFEFHIYMLLSKCLFGIQIFTCFVQNVCLESQSLQASLHAAIVFLEFQPLHASLRMSIGNSNPHMLLSKCLFGIPILTCFSPNVFLE